MMKPSYVRVIIDRAIHRELDYLVPETLSERISVGSRVRVPFRDKSALATVVATLAQSEVEGIRADLRGWVQQKLLLEPDWSPVDCERQFEVAGEIFDRVREMHAGLAGGQASRQLNEA